MIKQIAFYAFALTIGLFFSEHAYALGPIADMTTALDIPTLKTDMSALVVALIGLGLVVLAGVKSFGLIRKFAGG